MEHELRLCVIDDIKAVVNGIARQIPWETHGIRVVGTASNGEQGLDLIRRTEPHIVLTDIRMPRMNGLEMTRLILNEHPDTRIVFLSGYPDFEYAQEAVRLGAFDYIVKPFTPQKIIDVVLKAKAAVLEELGQQARLNDMERKLRESLPYLRQEYFQLLLQFPTTPELAARRWAFLGIPLESRRFIVMLVEIDGFAGEMLSLPVQEVELIRFALQNILEETIASRTKGVLFRDPLNRFVAVFNPPAATTAEALAELCLDHASRYAKRTISVGLGLEVEHIHEISFSYAQALEALSNTFYTGGNSVYSYRKADAPPPGVQRYSTEQEKELFYCLRSGNARKAEELLDELFSQTSAASALPPDTVKAMNYELAVLISRTFAEKLSPAEMEPLEEKLQAIRKQPSLTLTDLQRRMKELCRSGCEQVQRQQNEEAGQVVQRVMDYIREHLSENLTVSDYARLVYLSGSYFANLFKKVTGMTVGQFVTAERMERAKTLLLEGMQVQEIAQSLGYEDRPYFSELFKKHTAMTPSEFKQHYMR